MVLMVYIFFLAFFIQLWRNGAALEFFGEQYKKHLFIIVTMLSLSLVWEVVYQMVNTRGEIFFAIK